MNHPRLEAPFGQAVRNLHRATGVRRGHDLGARFNEGVDLPTLDTIMMLRPTESSVLAETILLNAVRIASNTEVAKNSKIPNPRALAQNVGCSTLNFSSVAIIWPAPLCPTNEPILSKIASRTELSS